MPQYKLTYFDVRALGENARMLFALAGQEYEDKRLPRGGDEFKELKPLTPFGQLPLLEVEGKVICQSKAICRYLARKFGLAGKTDWDKATVDMIVDSTEDLNRPLVAVFKAKDEDKPALVKAYQEGHMPSFLSGFERILENNGSGYFVGDEITWADVAFLNATDFGKSIGVEEIDASKFPKCLALRGKVLSHSKIAEWVEKRPVTMF